ncbi:MAG: hypothetical protein ACM3Q2_02070 [Syntrophothermus sp.]
MSLESIIIYSTIVCWLLPPVRQYRGSYFYFFLVLAIQDPITQIISNAAQISANIIYSFGLLFLLLTLVNKKTIRRFYPVWLVMFFLLLVYIKYRLFDARYIMLAEMLVLIYMTMKRSIEDYIGRQKIHIPHIILLLYTVSLFTKYMFYVMFKGSGYLYFYLTTVFENLVAIYFTCVRLEDFSKVTGVTAEAPYTEKTDFSIS